MDRARLQTLIRSGKHPARKLMRARILLKADASEAGDAWSDSQIAAALDTGLVTVARIRQQLVKEGVQGVLTPKRSSSFASRATVCRMAWETRENTRPNSAARATFGSARAWVRRARARSMPISASSRSTLLWRSARSMEVWLVEVEGEGGDEADWLVDVWSVFMNGRRTHAAKRARKIHLICYIFALNGRRRLDR